MVYDLDSFDVEEIHVEDEHGDVSSRWEKRQNIFEEESELEKTLNKMYKGQEKMNEKSFLKDFDQLSIDSEIESETPLK